MRISIIVQGLGVKSGGPSRSVLALAEGLRASKHDVDIITTNSSSNPIIKEACWIKTVKNEKPGPFGYSSGILRLLKDSNSDVFHIQGMFSYLPILASFFARIRRIPYIVSPRGMMHANALKKSAKKKSLFRKLFIDRDLNKAACLHATCLEELNEIRNAGIMSPIAIIPNSINIPSFLPSLATSDKFRLGFVGRINEIKNIDGLMRAWKLAGMGTREDAELLIIGGTNLDTEKTYQEELYKLETELGITNINWAGMKTGKEKDCLLRSCTVAVLPSHSENFGMVIPEALINGIPCIASDKTPWKMLEQYHCGWSTANDPQSMAKVIKGASEITKAEIAEMGAKGQQMVVDHFSTEKATEKLLQMYMWVLGEAEKPEFVYLLQK